MRIIVVGVGQVGRAVAEGLYDQHEIVVVDHDPDKLDKLRYEADVMSFEGDGADLEVLEEAEVAEADMLIASTDDDRTNILVCTTASALNDELFSIARVAETGFLKSWEYADEAFNVDLMVGSDYLTARSLVRVGLRQRARVVEYFGRGRIEMVEFEVPPDSHLADRPVREVDVYEGVRYAAVCDDEGMEVAGGDTVIDGGSRLLVIGRAGELAKVGRDLDPSNDEPVDRVFILGGGEIAYQTARMFAQQEVSAKIVEKDRPRAGVLAKNLPDSFVLHADATDPTFLREEGLDRAQLVVSVMRPDERNLFAALQAKHLGAERAVSVVHEKQYESLFEASGVDVTVNPRNKVIEAILRHTRQRPLEKVAFIEDHAGEVLEVELDADSPLVGRPLEEAAADFPAELVIGAVSRGPETIIPGGETELRVGDHLVVYVGSEVVNEVVEWL